MATLIGSKRNKVIVADSAALNTLEVATSITQQGFALWTTGDFSSLVKDTWDTAYSWGDHASAGYGVLVSNQDWVGNNSFTGYLSFGSTSSRLNGSDALPLVQVSGGKAYLGSTGRTSTTIASSDLLTHTRGSSEHTIHTDYSFGKTEIDALGIAATTASSATTATKLTSIGVSFNGEYPMTINAGGIIYSHNGVKFRGSDGRLTATSFVEGSTTLSDKYQAKGSYVENSDSRLSNARTPTLTGNLLTAVPVNAVFTDTTYSVEDGGLTQKNFTTTLKSKLDGIAANANNYVLPTNINLSGNLSASTVSATTNLVESGQNLSNRYLGKTAKATDADKLDGLTSSEFSRCFKKDIAGISNADWTDICRVNGDRLGSAIEFSCRGTANNVVIAVTGEIIVNHSKDILIRTMSGHFTKLTIRVQSNDNEDFTIQAKYNSSNVGTLHWEIRPKCSEAVYWAPYTALTGQILDHIAESGSNHSSVGGSNYDIRTTGNISGYGINAYGITASTFTEGSTTLANKYLGKTAKAADADKLDGYDHSAFGKLSNTQAWTGNNSFTGNIKIPTASVVVGSGSGSSNGSYLQFMESNGTTRQGFVGFGSSGNNDLDVYNQVGDVELVSATGVVKVNDSSGAGRVWHAGNLGKADIDALNIDASTLGGVGLSAGGGAGKVAQYAPNGYLYTNNWIHPKDGTGLFYDNGTHLKSASAGSMNLSDSGQSVRFEISADTNKWKYLSLKNGNSTKWDIATKEDDLSGALQFRPLGGGGNTAYVTTGGLFASDNQGTLFGSLNLGKNDIDVLNVASQSVKSNTGTLAHNSLSYINSQGANEYNPTSDWWNKIVMAHGDPDAYYNTTLAMKMTGSNIGELQTRVKTNGNWGTWKKVFGEGNFGKTEIDALNIHAASATNATIAQQAVSASTANSATSANWSGYSNAVATHGTVAANANDTPDGRLEYTRFSMGAAADGMPVSDNANGVITVGQHSGGYTAQLGFSSDSNIYWRDNPSTVTGAWKKVHDSDNFGKTEIDALNIDADTLDGREANEFIKVYDGQLTDTDLDTLTTSDTGVYHSNTQYSTNTNIPYNNYFTLLNLRNPHGGSVGSTGNVYDRGAQIFYGDSPGRAYWRPYQGSSSGWHPWEQIYTSQNLTKSVIDLLQVHAASVNVSSSVTSTSTSAAANSYAVKVAYDTAYEAYKSQSRGSASNFTSGTLITTDINAATASGDSWILEITGKSYSGSNLPFKAVMQGYIYNGTVTHSCSGLTYGGSGLEKINVMELGGKLCFWFPRVSYWNSFQVKVSKATSGQSVVRNYVYSITDSVNPEAATKKVEVTLSKGFNSNNFGKTEIDELNIDADKVDGLHASQFLRSDTADTVNGVLTLGTSSGIKLPNNASNGIRTSTNHRVIDSTDSTLRIGDSGKHTIVRMHGQGSDNFRVYYGGTEYQMWHAGNFGKTQIDALDVHAASATTATHATQASNAYNADNAANSTNSFKLGNVAASGYMLKQTQGSYTAIQSGDWKVPALGQGTFAQASSVGKPPNATHGYWFNLGRRDGSAGGYAGIYVNSYQTAGSGAWLGRNDAGGDPSWEKIFTDKTLAKTDIDALNVHAASATTATNSANAAKLGNVEPSGYQLKDDTAEFSYVGVPTDDWEEAIELKTLSDGTWIMEIFTNTTGLGFYTCRWSATVAISSSNYTNDNWSSEIPLHMSGHANSSNRGVYARTTMHSYSTGKHLMLDIKVTKPSSTTATYTIKFRKLI